MRGKRGWVRILEATIAVMIVGGVMISVYSEQSSREAYSLSEYSGSLQNEILDDVSLDDDLRIAALGVNNETSSDLNYMILDKFANDSVPDSFSYYIKVCELGAPCNMPLGILKATLGYDIFVKDRIVSADLGNGTTGGIYAPKKIRLFFWDGKPAPRVGKVDFSDLTYKPVINYPAFKRYPFEITFTEVGGVDINVESLEKCFSYSGNCLSSSTSFSISAGESKMIDESFQTGDTPNDVTFTWSGTDANGNPVLFSYPISTNNF